MRLFTLVTLSAFLLNTFSGDVHAAPSSASHESFSDETPADFTTADYIIVGVGTAGGLLANRLSSDKKTSVIALQNGPNLTQDPIIKFSRNALFAVLSALIGAPLPFDPSTLNLSPALVQALAELVSKEAPINPLYINGLTVPQTFADGRQLFWAMAIPLGGASSVNAGAWCRGTNQLYSQWEAIAGPNWSVDRILAIYKELEDYQGKSYNQAFRGHCGPLNIRQVNPASKLSKKFTRAIIAATGYPFLLDYNDPETPIGVSSQLQYTQSCGKGILRVSSSTAFLDSRVMTPDGHGVKGRKLLVKFNSTATRVLWEGNTAVGVEYVQDGVTKQVFATKGVVVAAGLYSSRFLMNSGVGPQALLNSLGIPVIYDNPNVGQGLADQPHVVLAYATNPKDTPKNTQGVFAEIAWLPAPGKQDPIVRKVRYTTAYLVPGITLAILDLVQPASRGTISINSSDPLAPPVIDPNVLSVPADLELYQAALSTYVRAINAELQAIDPAYQMIFPDPAVLEDPLLLTQFIQEEIGPNQHWQCHCRMAPLSLGGVVDSTGHVYGVQNLIVADNSINSQNMDGSPMATAYLVAANIAKLLGY